MTICTRCGKHDHDPTTAGAWGDLGTCVCPPPAPSPETEPHCPKCGGPTEFAVLHRDGSGRRLFACRDSSCGGGVWVPPSPPGTAQAGEARKDRLAALGYEDEGPTPQMAALHGRAPPSSGFAQAGESAAPHCFDKRAADALAREVQALIDRKVIDARSPAADALLDYVHPGPTESVPGRLTPPPSDATFREKLDALLEEARDFDEVVLGWPLRPQVEVRRAAVEEAHRAEVERATKLETEAQRLGSEIVVAVGAKMAAERERDEYAQRALAAEAERDRLRRERDHLRGLGPLPDATWQEELDAALERAGAAESSAEALRTALLQAAGDFDDMGKGNRADICRRAALSSSADALAALDAPAPECEPDCPCSDCDQDAADIARDRLMELERDKEDDRG